MIKKNLSRDIIRPAVYKVFMRLVYGTVFSLLADFFITDPLRDIKSYGFALCAVLCALGAWLAYLRLDGMKVFRLPELHTRRREPVIRYGDMIDNVDEPIREMEELTDGEKDTALFIADILLAVLFAVISVIV